LKTCVLVLEPNSSKAKTGDQVFSHPPLRIAHLDSTR
jgi:hypothetical protein